MLEAMTSINRQIRELAPLLNGPTLSNAVEVMVEPSNNAIATMAKEHQGTLYIFAVSMTDQSSRATFERSKLCFGED
jgi:hypothetical protein